MTTVEAALAILEKIKGANLVEVSKGDADAMRSVTGDVNKLGLLLMCGDFAAPIQQAQGGEAVAGLLSAAVKAPDTKARANLVRGCITALGRAAGRGLQVAGALELVPVLVQELRENPGADVVKAVAALVSDVEVCEACVQHGCVAALMPLLDDPHLREPVFACLSAFAVTSATGAAELVRNGALPFVCAYLSEDMEQARAAGNLDEAVGLIASLAPHADAASLMSAGTLKVVNEILDSCSSAPGKQEVIAICGLMKTLSAVHATLLPDMVAGGARKLVGLASSLCALDDLDLARSGLFSVADLLETLCADASAAAKFQEAGAADALIAAMNKFPNDVELATKCAAVLGIVSGGGSALEGILARADELAAASAGGDAATLKDLAGTMRLLGNMVLQPGLVDQPAADRIMATITGALDVLYALPATSEQQDAINTTLALLSRLMAIEGVHIPEESALNCLQGAFGEGMGDQLKACACAALTSLGRRGPAAVRAIAGRGLISHMVSASRAGRAHAADGGLSGEAASALSELLTQALANAAELAQDPAGAAALAQLLGGIHDPGKLADALKTVLNVEGGAQALLEALTFMEYAAAFAGYEAAAAGVVDALAKHRDVVAAGQAQVAEAVPWKVEHLAALA